MLAEQFAANVRDMVAAALYEALRIGVRQRRRRKLAGRVEAPAVIHADEASVRLAACKRRDHRAAVRARIEEGADAAVIVASDHDGPARQSGCDVVAGLRKLGCVRDPLPCLGEDLFLLRRINLVVEVNPAIDNARWIQLEGIFAPRVEHSRLPRQGPGTRPHAAPIAYRMQYAAYLGRSTR